MSYSWKHSMMGGASDWWLGAGAAGDGAGANANRGDGHLGPRAGVGVEAAAAAPALLGGGGGGGIGGGVENGANSPAAAAAEAAAASRPPTLDLAGATSREGMTGPRRGDPIRGCGI